MAVTPGSFSGPARALEQRMASSVMARRRSFMRRGMVGSCVCGGVGGVLAEGGAEDDAVVVGGGDVVGVDDLLGIGEDAIEDVADGGEVSGLEDVVPALEIDVAGEGGVHPIAGVGVEDGEDVLAHEGGAFDFEVGDVAELVPAIELEEDAGGDVEFVFAHVGWWWVDGVFLWW